GCTFLSEGLPDIDSFNDIHPYFDDDPLSGSTTYPANSLLEEFVDELALISYPPDYDDYRVCDIESDIREIEFLLFQGEDSDFKDSIDQYVLTHYDDLFVDLTPEMFAEKQPPHYSFPSRFDVATPEHHVPNMISEVSSSQTNNLDNPQPDNLDENNADDIQDSTSEILQEHEEEVPRNTTSTEAPNISATPEHPVPDMISEVSSSQTNNLDNPQPDNLDENNTDDIQDSTSEILQEHEEEVPRKYILLPRSNKGVPSK
nr:hypothetical protein [Tanacetum cinerariifolium]